MADIGRSIERFAKCLHDADADAVRRLSLRNNTRIDQAEDEKPADRNDDDQCHNEPAKAVHKTKRRQAFAQRQASVFFLWFDCPFPNLRFVE